MPDVRRADTREDGKSAPSTSLAWLAAIDIVFVISTLVASAGGLVVFFAPVWLFYQPLGSVVGWGYVTTIPAIVLGSYFGARFARYILTRYSLPMYSVPVGLQMVLNVSPTVGWISLLEYLGAGTGGCDHVRGISAFGCLIGLK